MTGATQTFAPAVTPDHQAILDALTTNGLTH